jgi:hypothetical protein
MFVQSFNYIMQHKPGISNYSSLACFCKQADIIKADNPIHDIPQIMYNFILLAVEDIYLHVSSEWTS